jgi:predicted O-methyltransferase YrrM
MGHLNVVRAFVRQKRKEASARGSVKPWMRYMEIEIVEELLARLRPRNCLEWGAGYSTLHFPAFLGPEATWLAVEHNREWAAKIDTLNERASVRIHHVAANHSPWSDPDGDGAYSDLADYVDHPAAFAPFDFVLVDGRARASCLERALTLTTDRGLVLLHDAQRPYYHQALAGYEHQTWFRFRDRRARGRRERAFWIGSRGLPIGTVLDVSHHRRVWRLYDAIGTLVKVA